MAFILTSPAFKDSQPIPAKYTCEGQNISNPLVWTDPPPQTASFALINDDPDAGGSLFVHWIIYNLPAQRTELPENFPRDAVFPDGTLQGTNDFGRVGYGGPCPPTGTHRYFFKLYALDAMLSLPPKSTRKQLENAMKGHILGHAQLMGTYRKIKQ
jgi:Raf kinase inhibitor-like YbhB/YbcL family protein